MPRWTLVLAVLLGTGCRTPVPVQNVDDVAIPASGQRTLDDVAKAIQRAGTSLGWRMDPIQPGLMRATLHVRSHVATVSVIYDSARFSIRYRDSSGLGYDGETIHPNYNGWVKKLSDAIHKELAAI